MVAAFRTVYCACVLSRFSHVWLFGTPWTLACQAPLSMGFARQEYCSGLLSTPLGDLPDPGIKSTSPAAPALQGTFFVSVPPGKPLFTKYQVSGNPLQCSCLENPRDGGAWWAAVYGVAQSRTRLKWLSSSNKGTFWSTDRTSTHEFLWDTIQSITIHPLAPQKFMCFSHMKNTFKISKSLIPI